MHVMARETWTDERLDDLKEHMDTGFSEVKEELRQQREEVGGVRKELGELRAAVKAMDAKFEAKFETVDAKFEKVDARFDALNRTLQIGFGLIGSFLGVLAILIGTQF